MAFPVSDREHGRIKRRIEAQEELIVAAAIQVPFHGRNIVLFCERPGRHGDVIWPASLITGVKGCSEAGGKHGFVTNRGRFVDRQEAAKIVVASGQGTTRDFGPGYERALFSEDMWNDWDKRPAPVKPEEVF